MCREVKGLHRKVPESLQHTTPRCNTLQRNLYYAIIVFLGDVLHQRACIVESLQHTTHYNTLQQTAVHCSSLKHTATHCNTMQTWKNSGQSSSTKILTLGHRVFVFFVIWIWPKSLHVAVCFNVLQCVAVCCSVLQCILPDVLQCVAVSEANNSSECLASN